MADQTTSDQEWKYQLSEILQNLWALDAETSEQKQQKLEQAIAMTKKSKDSRILDGLILQCQHDYRMLSVISEHPNVTEEILSKCFECATKSQKISQERGKSGLRFKNLATSIAARIHPAELFDESKPICSGSTEVAAASAAVVAGAAVVSPTATDVTVEEIERQIREHEAQLERLKNLREKKLTEQTKKPENPLVVRERTAELAAVKRVRTSDGNLGQSQQ